MSGTRFTASNGWYIENGSLRNPVGSRWGQVDPVVGSFVAEALFEYGAHQAQAQRDAELGRWRSVDHPDWIVYPHEREDHVDLLNERNRDRLMLPRSAFYHVEDEDEAYAVASEYWAAHPVPEPKPWEQATPGEVWVLTLDGWNKQAALVDSDGGAFILRNALSVGTGLERDSERITAGQRIWPEEELK